MADLTTRTGSTTKPSTLRKTSAASLADVPDRSLVELARKKSDGAFEALMRRYNRRLFRVARSILRDDSAAEDTVQEAYIRAFTHLDKYKPTGSFAAWLTRIALNEALMNRRRQRKEVSLHDLDETVLNDERIDGADAPEAHSETFDAGHARRLLEHAVDKLPEHFRTVFILREVEQLSINDTAACLRLNTATVKTRLHRAQQRLRVELTRQLRRERISIFDFDGERCDRIVFAVLTRLTAIPRVS